MLFGVLRLFLDLDLSFFCYCFVVGFWYFMGFWMWFFLFGCMSVMVRRFGFCVVSGLVVGFSFEVIRVFVLGGCKFYVFWDRLGIGEIGGVGFEGNYG